jgi:anti-sigma factor RsiW
MKCTEARSRFSPYLDGVISGAEMQQLSEHMRQCESCLTDYTRLDETRSLVSSLGPVPAPPELARKLKISVASAISQKKQHSLPRYMVHLENLLNAFMVPATAGIFAAIVFFAVLIGTLWPVRAAADINSVASAYVPPRLEMSDAESQLSLDAPLVVEAYVDSYGRVENYVILSGQDDEQIHQQLNRALLFTVFAPAQLYGKPVAGKAIIYFSQFNVKG